MQECIRLHLSIVGKMEKIGKFYKEIINILKFSWGFFVNLFYSHNFNTVPGVLFLTGNFRNFLKKIDIVLYILLKF